MGIILDQLERVSLSFPRINILELVFLTIIALFCIFFSVLYITITYYVYLFDQITELNWNRKVCYVAVDFNTDLSKFDTHSPTADFVNCIFSHSFLSTINKPTRVTDYTAPLIDNIITNTNLKYSLSSIIYADISVPSFYIPTIKSRQLLKQLLSYFLSIQFLWNCEIQVYSTFTINYYWSRLVNGQSIVRWGLFVNF